VGLIDERTPASAGGRVRVCQGNGRRSRKKEQCMGKDLSQC
jgi:hypothetical protein